VRAYYNEIDPKVAAWLRELIVEGVIPDGGSEFDILLDAFREIYTTGQGKKGTA